MSYIQEEWKPVIGFEDIYEVSNLGRVKRVLPCNRSPEGGVLKPWPRGPREGYLSVQLCQATRPVHRLVAEAFLGPRPDAAVINHIDGNKHNNSAVNLEYASQQQNAWHARDAGLTAAKLTYEEADAIRTRHASGISQRKLAKEFNVSQPTISAVVNRERWSR